MSKPKNIPGTLIALYWEDDPDFLYTYGHVDRATFLDAVRDYYDTDDGLGFGRFPVLQEEPVHHYGRYCFNGSCDGETIRTLHTSPVKSRGAFPLTAAAVGWERHAHCEGYFGEERCWIRKGHTGPHLTHADWWMGREAARMDRGSKP